MNIQFDHLGFPLVWIDEIQAWLTFMPITKVQYEYYLCDRACNRQLNNAWYEERLNQRPRTTATKLSAQTYHNAFITGLTVEEAGWYVDWMFDRMSQTATGILGCRLPSDEEWKLTYRALRNSQPARLDWPQGTNGRAREIVERLAAVMSQPQKVGPMHLRVESANEQAYSMADQMLLRRGIYEWIQSGNGHCGRGAPPALLGGEGLEPDSGAPIKIPGSRHPAFGFRVLIEGNI